MSRTQDNLRAAFAGESEARNRYTFFAQIAKIERHHRDRFKKLLELVEKQMVFKRDAPIKW